MGVSILQIVGIVLAAGVAGAAAGFLAATVIANRRMQVLVSSSATVEADLTTERDHLAKRLARSQSKVDKLQAAVTRNRSKLGTAVKKAKQLTRGVVALRAEREDTKIKISTLQSTLVSVKQQTQALQQEFDKVGDFYKRELAKSLQKRKALEKELVDARAEEEAFAKMVETSVLEHGSPEEMITAAQLRLGQIKVLERNVEKLEAENGQLRADAARMTQEYGELQKNLAELDELRINNQQLVRCVESLESSRKQQEQAAEEHRIRAEESEELSDTLRLKLDDLEKSFADIEQQQHEAIKHVREATTSGGTGHEDVVDLASYSSKR